ncbi:cell division protein FtsQ/DivIB [Neptuniibacter caesariensis]|uniref:Cell division protein FtsQ n=1 Tax=Neptuniibacter caesariensis TaxID=207954 RepID=A0A7U8C1Z6_NEPCE|nr:cell division protein FtsQ/DivIB [Neptuniibacter caesariensis]EAR59714.1 cell division protein FtsQ, putative [Oceanospirillum sp. MED92] [Neptuniibacter caesariensis]
MSFLRWGNKQNDEPEEEEIPRGASREFPERNVSDEPAEKEQEIWWKPFWTFSTLLIFFVVLWGLGQQVWQMLDKPISQIVVEGKARHLDRNQLAISIGERLEESLLSARLEDIQQLVSEHPWVRVSAIKRKWPETLVVQVEEEVPVARWGERGLLNHQGDIFWPELKEEYRALPRLSGPAPDTERVMSQFHDLNQMFRPVGLSVVSLDLEARGAWTLELDNKIKLVIGREAVNERLERFLDLYRLTLSERSEEIEQIDIRYTHGVAVKWREKPESEDAG